MKTVYKRPSSITDTYETYKDQLYRISVAILRSKEDAEDAVAEVFLKLLNKNPQFRDQEHEKAWLIRVTINQCHDIQRKRVIRSYTPLDEMQEKEYVNEEKESVLEEVLTLPEKYKTAIILFYFEDMSIEDVALTLRISKGAVKMRLSRGRELLKATIEGENENA